MKDLTLEEIHVMGYHECSSATSLPIYVKTMLKTSPNLLAFTNNTSDVFLLFWKTKDGKYRKMKEVTR